MNKYRVEGLDLTYKKFGVLKSMIAMLGTTITIVGKPSVTGWKCSNGYSWHPGDLIAADATPLKDLYN